MEMNLPNVLTLSRVAAVPVFAALFFLESATGQWLACALFAMAAITDFFDGRIARARDQQSAFGRFLDPIADKLLVSVALLMMVGFGQIGSLTIIPAAIILCREILISGLREFLAASAVNLPVSQLAKWKTTIQMFAIGFLIVGDAAHPPVPQVIPVRMVGEAGLWIAAAFTVITGYSYMRAGLRHMSPHADPGAARTVAESSE